MNQPNAWVNYGVGMVYMKKKRYEAAGEKFRELLATHPHYGDAIAQLGIIEKSHGRRDAAERYFEKALNHDPENEIANFQMGLMFVVEKKDDDAKAYFEKIINRNPSHVDSMIHLGILLGRKGKFDKAERLISEAYDKDPTRKNGFARLGWVKGKTQDWPGALEMMNRDYKANKISPAWQVNLALTYGRNNDFSTAMELMERAYTQEITIRDGYAQLGSIKAECQDWIGAIDIVLKDYHQKRLSFGWHVYLAMLLIFLENHEAALKIIEDAYSKDRAAKDGYARLGWAYYISSKNDQKLYFYIEKDKTLNRYSFNGIKINAWATSIRGDLSSANMLMDTLYSKAPMQKNGFSVMGWELIEKGDKEAGIKLMEKDYRLGRAVPLWRINYAYQLAKIGESQKARSIFNEIMEIEANRQTISIGYPLFPTVTMTKGQFVHFIEQGGGIEPIS